LISGCRQGAARVGGTLDDVVRAIEADKELLDALLAYEGEGLAPVKARQAAMGGEKVGSKLSLSQ
jgi:hypothetical protein